MAEEGDSRPGHHSTCRLQLGCGGQMRARPCWRCGGRRRSRRGGSPDVDGSLDVRYADGDYERAVRPAALHLLAAAPCCGRGCAAAARVARRGRGEAGAPGASAAAGAGGGPGVIKGAGGSSTGDGSVDSDVRYADGDCCGGAAAARCRAAARRGRAGVAKQQLRLAAMAALRACYGTIQTFGPYDVVIA